MTFPCDMVDMSQWTLNMDMVDMDMMDMVMVDMDMMDMDIVDMVDMDIVDMDMVDMDIKKYKYLFANTHIDIQTQAETVKKEKTDT